MPFISYAQNYEDVMLWRVLRDVERGFYVDVGAGDPEIDSVTRAFYERGWSGINIEPLEEHFERLKRFRPRDTNLQVAAGREAGLRTFHAFARTDMSTLDAKTSARHQVAGFSSCEILISTRTLTEILEDYAPPTIHFLKIDVEGTEAEVLEGLDLRRLRPWIIVIEAMQPRSGVSTRSEWGHLITGRGYGLAYFDGLNCFYVADEVAGLKERLAVAPNCFDDFVRWPEWFNGRRAAILEQKLATSRERLGVISQEAVNLHNALLAGQAQVCKLRGALEAEQARTGSLLSALQAKQIETNYLQDRLQQLEAEQLSLAKRVFMRLSNRRNRRTGGGLMDKLRSMGVCRMIPSKRSSRANSAEKHEMRGEHTRMLPAGVDPFRLEELTPATLTLDKRVEMATKCRDMDDIRRVPRAGQVQTLPDQVRVQIMHNGLRVLADGYYGRWTTRLIELCRGCHEPQEERVFHEVMTRLPADATMIELGGYWAFYSLWFLLGGKHRRSIVVEPDPKHLRVGQTNACLNGLTPTFIHAFVGSTPSPPGAVQDGRIRGDPGTTAECAVPYRKPPDRAP